jgi:enoyl-CoA hydratase/carnithine racemase
MFRILPTTGGLHMADQNCVKVSHDGSVAILSMEFAPHNLLGLDLMSGMRAGLAAAQDAGSRAVLLKSGLRHFSAGADTSLFGDAIRLKMQPFASPMARLPCPVRSA